MSSGPKKAKRRQREAKREASKEPPPQVVTRALADNTYHGIIREGAFGEQYLECADAKYTWHSGVQYEGPFVASRIEGTGRYTWPDGSTYEGELLNGKRHGQGVYFSADGLTRYEGGWSLGKRSGKGRLTYNPEGTSCYDGGWKDGKKHGYGRQLWPSGNVYEGEWLEGKMSGKGRMVWRTAAGSEEYVGVWEANEPHGEGTHTWHATDITLALWRGPAESNRCETPVQRKPVPYNPQQQQMNNRYEGQFCRGKRHGSGAFFYANGAYYRGEWQEHVKHGHGRHTFEDGTVYDGPFEEDQMTEYARPPPAEGAELLARSMELSDIDCFALPHDRSGFEASIGAGYSDHGKIFREVCNMLLRHLGELRDYYAKYRAAIPRQSSDPFALKMYQFWLFARDTGLLSPTCSLARLNRTVFSGPRHQSEVSPEDLIDIRPITQSEVSERRSLCSALVTPTAGSQGGEPAPLQDSEASDLDSESEPSSPSNTVPASSAAVSPSGADAALTLPGDPAEAPADEPQDAGEEAAEAPAKRSEAVALEAPLLGPSFRRGVEGGPGFADTHEPTRQLLLRHFLEGIVRLAPVCYPNERGMEVQIHRAFKGGICPGGDVPAESEHVFGFLADPDLQQVIEECSSELRDVFECPGPGVAEEAERQMVDLAMGGLGRTRRQLHVRARREAALRIKDVLRLLDSCGLLGPEPPAAQEAPAPEEAGMDDGEASADEAASGGGSSADKDVATFLDDANSMNGQAPDFGFMKQGSMAGDAFGELGGVSMPKHGRKRERAAREGQPPGADEAKEPSAADVAAQCDFVVTPLEVLRVLAEPMAPRFLKGVCYEIGGLGPAAEPPEEAPAPGPGDPVLLPTDEQLPLLEFVEGEVVYAEFVRLLLRMAERGTAGHPLLAERVPLPRRFHAFLRHVLLPALRARYEPPKQEPPSEEAAAAQQSPPPEESAEAEAETGDSEATSQTPAADAPPADAPPAAEELPAEAEPEGDGAPAEAEEAAPAGPVPELWRGFDALGELPPRQPGAGAAAVAVALRGARRWPAGYADEVLQW